jgi:hypothetical protein
MSKKTDEFYKEEYEGRFEWRKERQIYNLSELYRISGDWEFVESLNGLFGSLVSDDPKDALKWSILNLWLEARECFVFGEFQACILTSGAVIERCLKLEYEKINGILPIREKLTLGRMIRKCKGIVDKSVLDLAQQILEPRNSRAHALLEHINPQLAMLGGPERGIEIRSPQHRLIEAYRGEAGKIMELNSKILAKLYQKSLA